VEPPTVVESEPSSMETVFAAPVSKNGEGYIIKIRAELSSSVSN